jgi:hypothetical protein
LACAFSLLAALARGAVSARVQSYTHTLIDAVGGEAVTDDGRRSTPGSRRGPRDRRRAEAQPAVSADADADAEQKFLPTAIRVADPEPSGFAPRSAGRAHNASNQGEQ